MKLRGDCREQLKALPDDAADLIVAGLPFWGKPWGWSGAIGAEPNFGSWLCSMCAVFSELHRVLTPDGHAWVVAGDPRGGHAGQPWRLVPVLEDLGWVLQDRFVWVYERGMSHFQDVLLLSAQRDLPTVRPCEAGMVWHIDCDQVDPVAFPELLVHRMLDITPARILLDPFAGTGTVGRVARRRGLGYILVEGSDRCPTPRPAC